MARSEYWGQVPVARPPDPPPASILRDSSIRFSDASHGGGRPSGCVKACKKHHGGTDLLGNGVVVAPESAVVEVVDRFWTYAKADDPEEQGQKKRTDSMHLRSENFYFVLGGLKPRSREEFSVNAGDRVTAGQPIGRVHPDYDMIHFEIYDNTPDRTSNSRWKLGQAAPVGQLNPVNYVQAMAGEPLTIANYVQRNAALYELGVFDGPITDQWTEASKQALRKAQSMLGLAVDGAWGKNTDTAVRSKLDVRELPTRMSEVGDASGTDQAGDPSGSVRTGRLWVPVVGVSAVTVAAGVFAWSRWRAR